MAYRVKVKILATHTTLFEVEIFDSGVERVRLR